MTTAREPAARTFAGEEAPTRFRWVVVGLLAIITLVNYLDRAAIGFAAPEIERELGLDATALGLMMGAFGIGYFLSNPVCGALIDRRGVRAILTVTILLWAASMGATALAHTVAGLAAARVLLGLAEGGSFPAMSGVVTRWLPPERRGSAFSLALAAVPLSLAIGGPLLSALVAGFGWRATYAILAASTLPWVALWWVFFRDDPGRSRFVNAAEARLVAGRTPRLRQGERAGDGVGGLREILTNRTILANNWAVFVWSFYLFFFMSWLPGYLKAAHGVDLKAVGSFSFVAWGLATLALWAVGRLSDRIFAATGRLRRARSLPIALAILVATVAVIPLAGGGSLALAYACLTIAIATLMAATAPLVAINVDLMPHRAALSHGIFTACLAGAGFVAPSAVGWLRTLTGSFEAGFWLMAGLGLSAVLVIALFHRPDADLSPAGRQALAGLGHVPGRR
ncbi:MFS transporter [Acuticoccus kandeliae]|uniref:MFS transporter n=1 Tax=Acuticoccus kandeliae TaxID=2073160 RepID=UPI000D3E3534|nr:MFS transporter [Acuticoccus kandeliae]